MLLTIIIWGFICVLIVVLNARFWKLFPDTQSDETKAKQRGIEPVTKPTPIPKSHYINYYIDWAIVIAVLVILFS